jgi:uncharacterized membrane protein YozB (DUF420 family)
MVQAVYKKKTFCVLYLTELITHHNAKDNGMAPIKKNYTD